MGIFAGQWLDGMLHSGMLLTLIGACVGLVAGITSTIALYRATLHNSALEWRQEQDSAASAASASRTKRPDVVVRRRE